MHESGLTPVRQPPVAVVFVAVLVIALGETGGAVMSGFQSSIGEFARARIVARSAFHGLTGDVEYDREIVARAVFATEAGLSFFHTHGEGLGLVVLFVGSVVASAVPWRRVRGLLYACLTVGGLFPLGYLVYAAAVLESGRDAGTEFAEWYLLTPLGGGAILGILGAALAVLLGRRRTRAA